MLMSVLRYVPPVVQLSMVTLPSMRTRLPTLVSVLVLLSMLILLVAMVFTVMLMSTLAFVFGCC